MSALQWSTRWQPQWTTVVLDSPALPGSDQFGAVPQRAVSSYSNAQGCSLPLSLPNLATRNLGAGQCRLVDP